VGVYRDMRKVILVGPLFSRSGYGEHVRCVYRSLAKHPEKYDVFVRPTGWGQTSWSYSNAHNPEEHEAMMHCIQKQQMFQGDYDISVQVLIPNEWQSLARKNIGITAGIETDRASGLWIEHCNVMDKVIVISEHSYNSFKKSEYTAIDEKTNQPLGKLTCTVPMDIIGYPVKEHLLEDNTKLDIKLDTEFNFLTVAQAGPRKALHETVIWFAEEFKDDENVGLVVKTNQINNSVMDRDHMAKSLKSMLNPIKDRKCKVYLLHGNLSEKELHSLYRNEKIKTYVTTTRGEGYGLPLFEAAYSGLPVIAPAWSGHVDFLYMPVTNKESKKVKKQPMFMKTKFILKEVQEDAVWENVINKDSKWAYSDEKSFKKNLRKATESYSFNKKNALQLQEYLRKEFHEDIIYKKYDDSICEAAPEEQFELETWLEEITKNLEVYD
jgi:glycosyltransferase involved in cell wall biosynthesis